MKRLLLLALPMLLFTACSSNDDEPTIPNEVIDEAGIDVAVRAVLEETTAEDTDLSFLMTDNLNGTWKVLKAEGIDEQEVTFLSSSSLGNRLQVSDMGGNLFPEDGLLVPADRTLFVYLSDGAGFLEENLYAVYEVVSIKDGKAELIAHSGPKAPEFEAKLQMEKIEGEATGTLEFTLNDFSKKNLEGTWEITGITRLTTGQDVLSALKAITASLNYNRPLPTLTFLADGSVSSSLDCAYFWSNSQVEFWGNTFVLYREDEKSSIHSVHSIIGVYEIENLTVNELTMRWLPGNGDSVCRMTMKKV